MSTQEKRLMSSVDEFETAIQDNVPGAASLLPITGYGILIMLRAVAKAQDDISFPVGLKEGYLKGKGQEAERLIQEAKYMSLLTVAQKAWAYLFRTATKDEAEAHDIRAELMRVFGELEALRQLGEPHA